MGAESRFDSEPRPPLTDAAGSSSSVDCGWGILGLYNFGYNLQEWIGTSNVARAIRSKDGGEVAVRCGTTKEEREALKKEYIFLSSLRHDAFIGVEDLYESQFDSWLIMNLCTVGPVEAHINKHGPFSECDGFCLVEQLLEGIHFVHSKGIVHCRLDASKTLLTDSSRVLKIADFRRAVRAENLAEVEFAPRGRVQYQAPELNPGSGIRLTAGIDIWSVGLCIYLICSGVLPFDASDADVAASLSSGSLPRISWDPVGAEKRDLVLKCLSVDPLARPSAKDLVENF